MTVPFAKLRDAVAEENRRKEELHIVELLVKKLFPEKPLGKTMADVRKFLVDVEEATVSSALSVAVPDLPFEVVISARSCNAHCLLTGDFRNNDTVRWAIAKIGQAYGRGEECAVTLKLNNLGVFVMHNVSMPSQANPRVVIPASTTGISQIQIIHLDYFADDYLGRRLGVVNKKEK